jgi:hydrophobic/amphiphilic exporter-1 (mainly G- bacteria), HAE1 family
MKREPIAFAIPRFSVSRPVTVLMILLTILVVGCIAYQRIPISLYPEGAEGTTLHVSASYPNASPRDVEEKVTRKMEDIIGTVPNVRRLTSWSGNGYAGIRVEFLTGTNLRSAYAMLSDRLDRVKPLLPDDVDRVHVRRWGQNDREMMNIVASIPPGMEDVAYRMDHFVKPVLQRIDGVGNVEIHGVQSREVQIELLDERLRSHRIDVTQMLNRLRDQNFAISGGYIMDGERRIYVRSLGRFATLEQIGELIVDPQQRLRLKDVANVRFRMPRRDYVYRVDGKPAIGIEIKRDSTGNITQISREVRETLEELKTSPQLAGMTFNIFNDQGRQVLQSINNLRESGLWGGLFAAIIIYTFLRAPRMTGILTLAIPLSLLCTIIVLFFMGWSLNMLTMMGLLLSVGMVVDNAIVIVENIYRQRQEGVEATRASIAGAGEVGLAVVMSTLTTIIVFLPLILMRRSGDFSFWMLRIGVPVIVSLAASLFIALVFVPLAAQRLSRGRHHDELRVVVWLRDRYSRALRWVLSHRIEAVMIVAVAMATLFYWPGVYGKVKTSIGGGIGHGGESSVWLHFDLPSGGDIERADAFFTRLEGFLEENRQRYGFDRVETRFGLSWGRVQIRLRQDPNLSWYAHAWDSMRQSDTGKWVQAKLGVAPPPKPMDRNEIEADIREKFRPTAGITQRSRFGSGGGGSQDAGMSFNLYGEDTATLLELAEQAVERLRMIPGLVSVDIDMDRAGQELRVELDRDRARRLGLDPRSVSSGISHAMRGREVGRFPGPDGRELRIFAQLAEGNRTGIDDVRSMTFPTDTGIDVPLESVADLNVMRTLGQIRREARQTSVSITARAPRADSRRMFEAVDKAMAGFELPRGYRWDKGREFTQQRLQEKQMWFAGALAVTFVFLLMGVLFESFVLPLAVIVAVPFAALGVYWTLYLTDTPLDMMARIGIVILVGVVVNNAIVLVDRTNRLRDSGLSRLDALLQAGRNRFRPILMTTCTTVFGMIPMAVGNAKVIGMPYAPLGRTMIGGLLAASVLTLVVVPLFYTFLDDLRDQVNAMWRSAFGRRREAGSALPGPAGGGAAAGVGRAGPVE